MKKKIIISGIFIALFFISFTSFSQNNTGSSPHRAPAWVSDKGYWVVETNIYIPKKYIVRFYNNEHMLVGTKDINGITLNMKKRKIKMRLKAMLESSLTDWASALPAAAGEDLARKP